MANIHWRIVLNTLMITAVAFDLVSGLRISVKEELTLKNFRQSAKSTIVRRHLPHPRSKRDASQSIGDIAKCMYLQGAFDEKLKENATRQAFASEVHLVGDSKGNLQLAWTGNDYEGIIVVTGENGISTVYRSDEYGKNFQNVSHFVKPSDGFTEITLQKHTNDSKIVYLVANSVMGQTSTLYVSLDGAKTFKEVQLEFKLDSSIVFHALNSSRLLAIDELAKTLYLSENSGLSWTKIKTDVVVAKWGTGSSVNEIFAVTNNDTAFIFFQNTMSTNNVLEKSTDLGHSWKRIYERVYTFGMGDKFLFASVYKDTSSDERSLVVSTDAGQTWNSVRLPTITPERFYSILDSSDGQIFIHVDHPGDTGKGTLYTSDATGLFFSESLQNHLYPNYEDLTDFYRVQSMRGVYIANQLLDDNSIRTMITFNRGGEWLPIKRPDGVPCESSQAKECYLQIHNLYSIKRGVKANPPMSVPNAVGLVLAHGHVADALQTTDPDVFVSSDGGYTWRFALEGAHHYQIADHGGLLVAIPADTETPSVLKFSTDEGRCWISYNFTEKKIVFTGLLIEPGNRETTVAIWGYTQEDRIWHTHILNFTGIVDKPCSNDDYEDWVPHQHNDMQGCLLGVKTTYKRLKADSWCYNGRAYEVSQKSETCKCTADDFDCDYGFKRVDDSCIKDTSSSLKEIDICLRGHEERFVPNGYHKIPGDRCSGGFLPDEAQMIDLYAVCSSDTLPAAASSDVQPAYGDKGQLKVVLLVLVAIASVVVVIVLLTYLAKKHRLIRNRPAYRYSSIKCEEDDGNFGIHIPPHTSTSLFEDSSDEEVPGPSKLLPNLKLANGQVKQTNGHLVTNGHIPSESSASRETHAFVHDASMKNKLFESDDELLD